MGLDYYFESEHKRRSVVKTARKDNDTDRRGGVLEMHVC